jgi:hypothetical protein
MGLLLEFLTATTLTVDPIALVPEQFMLRLELSPLLPALGFLLRDPHCM